jgi:hypothetical protein
VIGNHYILVAGSSFDRKAAGVIGVEFAQWFCSDEEQVCVCSGLRLVVSYCKA